MSRFTRWLFRQPVTGRRFRPGVLPLEDRVVPAWYTVELASPPEGVPGSTTATITGQLLPVRGHGRTTGMVSDPVEADSPAEAVQYGMTGTITVTTGGQSVGYEYVPANVGIGTQTGLPFRVEDDPGPEARWRCPIEFWGGDRWWDVWVQQLPVVSVARLADAAEAGPTAGAFRFSRSGPTTGSLAVTFDVSGTAEEGEDYAPLPRSVTFAAGESSVDLAVEPFADNVVEGPESVGVTIQPNPTAYRIGTGSAALDIVDDPAIVTVSASGTPSEVGPTTGTFTFSRSGGDLSQPLGVSFWVSGTATEGVDYESLGGLVTIPAGESSVSLTLTPYVDGLMEGPETVRVEILDIPIIAYIAGIPRIAELAIIDAQIGLRSVTFGGTSLFRIEADPGEPAYPTAPPHWVDVNLDGDTNDVGEYSLPVGYVRNTQMTLSARFEYNAATPSQVLVRADGPGSLDLPATVARVEGSYIVLDPTLVPIAHPDWVEYYETFDLAWSVSVDGGPWTTVGISKNRMYVTLETPQLDTIYHTVVWISTQNAPKAKTPEEVTAGTWGKFAGRAVTSEKGKKLHYYKDWDVASGTTARLLELSDGQCMAWTRFFLDSLAAQGIVTTNNYVEITPFRNPFPSELNRAHYLVVNSWTTFGTGTSGNATFPYRNALVDPTDNAGYEFKKPDGTWEYRWGMLEEASDRVGLPGQNTTNPRAMFTDHVFANMFGKIYDPSYGISTTNTLMAWEEVALFGVAATTYLTQAPATFAIDFRPATSSLDTSVRVIRNYRNNQFVP